MIKINIKQGTQANQNKEQEDLDKYVLFFTQSFSSIKKKDALQDTQQKQRMQCQILREKEMSNFKKKPLHRTLN